MDYDIIIKNCKIIDGTGNPWYNGEIGIHEGHIVDIKRRMLSDAQHEIDAKGKVVCPGFIDIHSHSDYILPFSPRMESSILQGITTHVIGMCGEGLAPIPIEKRDDMIRMLSSITPIFSQIEINWATFNEYLSEMEKLRCPLNSVFFVGYGNIRVAGGQGFEDRPATPQELENMKSYIREAMEAGAFGMSTGLIYDPQVYVSTKELIELAKVVAEYDGLYFSHIRGEGKNVLNAVKECIEIVEKSGVVGGQIAHHKIAGKRYWGLSEKTIKIIEEANEKGISIYCDSYPYTRGMTSLKTALPPRFREGGDEIIIEKLKEPKFQKEIIREIEKGEGTWENFIKENGFENIFIASVNNNDWKEIMGKSISEITNYKNFKNDWETFFKLLIEDNLSTIITIETMDEKDITRIITSKFQMFGTDGLGLPINPNLPKFHPRCFGTYPKVFSKYVRENKVLTIEEAIRKMTSFPAQRLMLTNRGLLKKGFWADIIIFDPIEIEDLATYVNPYQPPKGISHVIVNGTLVVKDGKQNRKHPGRVLRHDVSLIKN